MAQGPDKIPGGKNIDLLKYIGLLVIVILVLGSLLYLFRRSSGKPPPGVTVSITPAQLPQLIPFNLDKVLTTSGRFPQDQQIAKVGNEIIYGRDLNYILYTRFPSQFASSAADLSDLKEFALPAAINDSVLLQSDKTALIPEIFNSPDKNEILRQEKIDKITSGKIQTEEKISGAMITVWFHNVELPEIPLADAEKLAYDTINGLFNKIKSGQMTFQEAGDFIRSDTALAKIDLNYKGNAYFEFEDRTPAEHAFSYAQLDSILANMKEGEMSDIIRIPDAGTALGSKDEEFYAIIKVYKRANPTRGSFLEWLDNEKKNYDITIF